MTVIITTSAAARSVMAHLAGRGEDETFEKTNLKKRMQI